MSTISFDFRKLRLGTSGEANQANARGEGNARGQDGGNGTRMPQDTALQLLLRGGDLAQKAADHANELLSAFESLKDMLQLGNRRRGVETDMTDMCPYIEHIILHVSWIQLLPEQF